MSNIVEDLLSPYTQDQSRRVALEVEAADEIQILRAEIKRLKNWQPVATAPDDTYVLVLWGSNADGPEGIEIAERRDDGYWITHGGERIDADGYRVLGWIPLPEKTTVLAGKQP